MNQPMIPLKNYGERIRIARLKLLHEELIIKCAEIGVGYAIGAVVRSCSHKTHRSEQPSVYITRKYLNSRRKFFLRSGTSEPCRLYTKNGYRKMIFVLTETRARLMALAVVLLGWSLLAFGQPDLKTARELVSKGLFDKAVPILRQMIAADPNRADARTLLGTTLALQGIRGEAIEQMAEAVRLNPRSAQTHNAYGRVLSRFVELKAARQEFEQALELEPGLAEAHVNLSLILAQAGDLSGAGDHLDYAIELEGDSPNAAYAHYLKSKILGAQDQIDKSITELQKAVQLRADYEEAWSDLGGMRRLALDNRGAVEALRRAVALKPEDALAQYRLGQLYLQSGDSVRAVNYLRKALAQTPNDSATLYNLMLALRKTGHVDEAKAIEKQIAALKEQNSRASEVGLAASGLNSEGIVLEKSGDVRGALAKYRAALDLDPTSYGFRLNYALALCRLGRWQDGIAELREVLRVDPDNADAAKALYVALDQTRAHSGEDARKVSADPR
jgi:tetratricopeptide (TPR) repeat protein